MDLSQAPRLAAFGTSPLPRADIVATTGSVAVELAPEQTVQSAPAGEPVRYDLREDAKRRGFDREAARGDDAEDLPAEKIEKRLVVEPQTRSLVMEERDPDTGETTNTIPDEATLKLRIFARELAERQRDPGETDHLVERTA